MAEANPLEVWFKYLETHPPRGRRRRRVRSPVPFPEWAGAFKIAQSMVADILDEALYTAEAHGLTPPRLYGSHLRILFNRLYLSKIRNELAKMRGVETPEQVEAIVRKYVEEFYRGLIENPEEILSRMTAMGVPEGIVREYIEYTRKIKPYLEKTLEEKLGRRTVAA